MDLELLQLAIKSIANELQENKVELLALRAEVKELKRGIGHTLPSNPPPKPVKDQDELLTIFTARKILNVGRNTFISLVRDGLIQPIRMNLRTIRYSRIEIQRYIQQSRSQAF